MPAPAATGALDDAVAAFKPLARGGLEATLERLEATAADAMARWTSSDDFAKVDLVVAHLLRDGSPEAALTYLRKMREALHAVARAVRKLHNLPEGCLTPERHARHKSREEQAADKAALHQRLQAHLESQIKLPPGYKALSPFQQDAGERRAVALRDRAHLSEKALTELEAKHAAMERAYVACRIERDDLAAEKGALARDLRVAQEHVARIKGTTSASGLDVFAANEKVREQQRAIAALRLEVAAWEEHAGRSQRDAAERQAAFASLSTTCSHQRARIAELEAADAAANGEPLKPRGRNALMHDLSEARREAEALRRRCAALERARRAGTAGGCVAEARGDESKVDSAAADR